MIGGGQTQSVSAQLPADWPSVVPKYKKGRLTAGFIADDGTVVASWDVRASANDVAGGYGDSLLKRGFRRYEWFSRNGMTGFEYAGHGLIVTVGTIEVNGTTSLHVEVSPR